MMSGPEEEREIYGDSSGEEATRYVAAAMAATEHAWPGAFEALPTSLQEDYQRLAAVAVDAYERFNLRNGAK